MRRRAFIKLLGAAAAASPFALHAQQPATPVIGFLTGLGQNDRPNLTNAFRRGLGEAGYVEGRNVAIEYRFAENQYDRLPALAADLVGRKVAVIAATGGGSAILVSKAATTTIPIVFTTGGDPVQEGFVASLNRPGGNATGVNLFTKDVEARKLELLSKLVSADATIAFLVNPSSQIAEIQMTQMREIARSIGQAIMIVNASTETEIDLAFATLVQRGAGALLMSADTFFQVQREQLVALAARHAVPAMYEWREFVRAGGLMSYSTMRSEYMLQVGVYVGRILNGAKIADLPVVQSTKFELVINLKTAKALGLDVPATLLARADEVIE